MNNGDQNSILESGHDVANVQHPDRSWPFLWGLVLGILIAVFAAVRRWLQTAGKKPSAQSVDATMHRPPTEFSATGAELSTAESEEGRRHPGVIDMPPGVETSPGQPEKVAGPGSIRYESPGHTAEPERVPTPASTRWQEPTKYIVGAGLFLAVLFLLYISRSVIPTVVVAALLALIVHPVIGFFQQRLKLRRGLSIAVTYLLIVGLFILVPLIVVPSIINAINDLVNIDFQAWADSASQAIQSLSDQVARIPVVNSLLGPLLDSVGTAFQGLSSVPTPAPVSYDVAMSNLVDRLSRTLGIVAGVLGPVISAVISLVFMLLISLHLSLSGQNILEGVPHLLSPRYESEIAALIERIGGVWVSFLRGQFALMVIIALIVWLGNAILGNRYPLLLGIISGTLEIIPNLGPALALIPGVTLALIFGSSHFAIDPLVFAVIVLAFYLLVQVFENQLIVPYVLGGELDVPPLTVILGVMIGGTVAGILGVLLATPFIATGRELSRYLYDKILEVPEESELEEGQPSFLVSIGNRIRSIRLPFRRRSDRTPVSSSGPG